MRRFGLWFSLLTVALLVSCAFPTRITEVKGSGNLVTESRRITGINAVDLSGIGTLIIEQGDTDALEITADENIMQYIRSDVSGGKLALGTREFINLLPSREITYRLTVRDLSAVEASGVGNIEIKSLRTDRLWVEISGSGSLKMGDLQADAFNLEISGMGTAEVSGSVEEQSIDISGTGGYHAGNLQSQKADIKISGSGSAVVWAQEELNLDISGMGDLSYYGEPVLNTDISGMGNLKSLGKK